MVIQMLNQLRARTAPWPSDTAAEIAPEEANRVPMPVLDPGAARASGSLRFLRTLVAELPVGALRVGRQEVDSGKLPNGVHTESAQTDWMDFDRAKDPLCLKALTLDTGTSFV